MRRTVPEAARGIRASGARAPGKADGPPHARRRPMIGALILGLLAGFIGKALMPGKDPGGFIVTIGLGLLGAFVGWLIFTKALGIGDDDMFDLGGLVGAIIGTMVVLWLYRMTLGRSDAATT